ncbi:MAG: response regulator transcription factor [Ignavibacteria bacterium]|jgi:DNA-binding response OmpR family regulator
MKKILIIEDDPVIIKGLEDNLKIEHYNVISEIDGAKGLNAAIKHKPDLILLDVMLPVKNGFEICKELRQGKNNTPIIMLTAKNEEADKVLGLELGADDYVTKPFSIRELIARIKAILRRREAIVEEFNSYSFADIKLDFKKMEAFKGKKKIEMSLKEYEIMKFFIKHEEEVVSRNMLLDEVWGYDVFPTTRTVDNYILMLRKKLEEDHSSPKHILTVHSVGYRFVK